MFILLKHQMGMLIFQSFPWQFLIYCLYEPLSKDNYRKIVFSITDAKQRDEYWA